MRENVKKNGVMGGVTDRDLTEYSIHTLVNPTDQKKYNEWALVPKSRNSKKMCTTYSDEDRR